MDSNKDPAAHSVIWHEDGCIYGWNTGRMNKGAYRYMKTVKSSELG